MAAPRSTSASPRAPSSTNSDNDPEQILVMVKRLGKGSFGIVWSAQHKILNRTCAVKIVQQGMVARAEQSALLSEIKLLAELNHPKIVGYFGSYAKRGKLYICQELMDAGSLTDFMRRYKIALTESQAASAVRQALAGLTYLHTRTPPCLHRDIKGANLLLRTEPCGDGTFAGEVKLADFGISARLESVTGRSTQVGSPYWMAPEILDEAHYFQPVDIWSLGITAIELVEKVPPYFDIGPVRAMYAISASAPPSLSAPDSYTPVFADWLSKALVKDPAQRATAQQLEEHPWITGALPLMDCTLPAAVLARAVSPFPGSPSASSTPGGSISGETPLVSLSAVSAAIAVAAAAAALTPAAAPVSTAPVTAADAPAAGAAALVAAAVVAAVTPAATALASAIPAGDADDDNDGAITASDSDDDGDDDAQKTDTNATGADDSGTGTVGTTASADDNGAGTAKSDAPSSDAGESLSLGGTAESTGLTALRNQLQGLELNSSASLDEPMGFTKRPEPSRGGSSLDISAFVTLRGKKNKPPELP